MKKKISVFGSTGSVGRQVVEVLKRFYLDEYQVNTISCNKNYKLAAKQAIELGAANIVLNDANYLIN